MGQHRRSARRPDGRNDLPGIGKGVGGIIQPVAGIQRHPLAYGVGDALLVQVMQPRPAAQQGVVLKVPVFPGIQLRVVRRHPFDEVNAHL